MGKTYRRPPIKQHKELEEAKYRSRVENNKKKQNKNKHPKRLVNDEIGELAQESIEGYYGIKL